MSTNITVTQCKQSYNGYTNIHLIRGVGRKTVRVITRPTNLITDRADKQQLVIDAAKIAVKNGWRNAIISTDIYMGDTFRVFNIHQYKHERWEKGHNGIFLNYF